MVKILLLISGSVAVIKTFELINLIYENIPSASLQIVLTKCATHFIAASDISKRFPQLTVYQDEDEWTAWTKRGDPVLHIELSKWADVGVVAPLSANTLAKVAGGICDNLLTNALRAWRQGRPLIVCPAMNSHMYIHPLTKKHLDFLCEELKYVLIPPQSKRLMCGEEGIGAMADTKTIVEKICQICPECLQI